MGQTNTVEDFNILPKPTRNPLYIVTDKYSCAGHVFLDLKPAAYIDFPPTVTVAFNHHKNAKTADDIAIGDKIQYTRDIDYKTGERNQKSFFNGQGAVTMISHIKTWKPNVVSLVGWRNLQQPQTRFKPRLF